MPLMVPTVHLNGTSKGELLKQLTNAMIALNDALIVMGDAYPNGRDYYPQGPDAIGEAMRQADARFRKVQDVRDEIAAIVEAIP